MTTSWSNTHLYTRNGFIGPVALLARDQYAVPFTRISGTYAPRRLSVMDVPDRNFTDPRSLPTAILTGDGVSIETIRRKADMPFALRNVRSDELHYIYSGSARLETDFGALDVGPGDFVLIPRAVTYRFRDVQGILSETIVVTASELSIYADMPESVLDVKAHVEVPDPSKVVPIGIEGEYEIVVRHGNATTSYFFNYDPLPTAQVTGSPFVQRFNLRHLNTSQHIGPSTPPPRVITDPTTNTLMFYMGSRPTDQPPIHHNADYDEVVLFLRGPGAWGGISEPGTVAWVPKGVVHQGPTEDVPEGFHAFLVECRAPLSLTPVGEQIAFLAEPGLFHLHESVATLG